LTAAADFGSFKRIDIPLLPSASPSEISAARFEIILEDNRVVVFFITSGENKCHRSFADKRFQLRDRIRIIVKFAKIALAEFTPF
jgi:hypothetical protein